jgi:hypothetical protein
MGAPQQEGDAPRLGGHGADQGIGQGFPARRAWDAG